MKRIYLLLSRLPNSYIMIGGGTFLTHTSPLRFNGLFSIILWINSFSKKRWIVSTYNNYEWINTHNAYFKFVMVWMCKLEGYQEFYVEAVDKAKDQILFHSAYDNFY